MRWSSCNTWGYWDYVISIWYSSLCIPKFPIRCFGVCCKDKRGPSSKQMVGDKECKKLTGEDITNIFWETLRKYCEHVWFFKLQQLKPMKLVGRLYIFAGVQMDCFGHNRSFFSTEIHVCWQKKMYPADVFLFAVDSSHSSLQDLCMWASTRYRQIVPSRNTWRLVEKLEAGLAIMLGGKIGQPRISC